ncbi:peptidoglycan editing factor PgeF [Brevibacillus choshinensis]|uniref:peptidoglycan editing factor PgeF n=1 Tax=Brevibacillus choshinensis TaxID=54911 RepID=UPI002E1AD897|nr:peptidoglycan editing factor PgeF [Brevibacillus choshinensis]MED4752099.1 peptidoglycan editing factor PgeF [Brevibacillus choshinensis]MED4784530.1 peptidoglycan editing factor PgeF [Brevibacillus choshinensis]
MREPFVMAEEKPFLHLQEWEDRFPGLVAGFTIRTGGVSVVPYGSFNMGLHVGDDAAHVVANRKALAEQLQIPFEAWTCADQVHGNQVCQVVAAGAGRESLENVIRATDGLFTEKAEVLLASFYADCVPLFFLDPVSGAIGLAHAGWKGTVGRIAEEMVIALESQYQAKRENLLVAIGPSIGGCCYEVDERIMAQVRVSAKKWEGSVTPSENGRYMLDLRKLNTEILLEAGISPANIAKTDWCTSCRTDMFFSHRKEAGASGTTGRMASFIGWKNRKGEGSAS